MIDELFTFPIVMIDGDNEEKKLKDREKLALPSSSDTEDYDIVFGEAEYPFWDFIGVEDRWLPTRESLERALEGDFDCCVVRFVNVGERLVPWTKKKFKAEIRKFAENYEASKPKDGKGEIKILNLSAEDVKKLLTENKQEEDE